MNSLEAYTLTGDYKVDYNEICKRSEVTPVFLRPRAQTPGIKFSTQSYKEKLVYSVIESLIFDSEMIQVCTIKA